MPIGGGRVGGDRLFSRLRNWRSGWWRSFARDAVLDDLGAAAERYPVGEADRSRASGSDVDGDYGNAVGAQVGHQGIVELVVGDTTAGTAETECLRFGGVDRL